MGKIHQVGNEYYVEFYARGLLYQQKAGKDPKQAQELLRSIEDKIAKGEVMTLSRQIDLDIFFIEFLKHAQAQYHPVTVKRLKSTIEHFSGFIRAFHPELSQLSQITPRIIEDYKAQGIKEREAKGKRPNSKVINLTLLLLREILDHGIKTGFINDNPTLHVKLLRFERSVKNMVDDEQCTKIFDQLHEVYKNIFLFMRYTGLRPTELIDLKWHHVDLNRGVIFIRSREVPLMVPAIKILEKLFSAVIDHKAHVFLGAGGEVIELGHLHEAFDNARSVAGLPSAISLLSLRHMFVAKLLMRRVPFLSIAKMSGLSDVAKLMRFAFYIPIDAPV